MMYDPNGNHNTFLQKWQASITAICTLGELPDWIEYCLFIETHRIQTEDKFALKPSNADTNPLPSFTLPLRTYSMPETLCIFCKLF